MTDSRNLCTSSQCMYSLKKGMGCVHLLFCSDSTVVRRQGENVQNVSSSPLFESSLTDQIPQASRITVRGLKSQCLSIYKVFDIKEVSLYWKHSITTGLSHPWFVSHLTVSLRCNWCTMKFTILSIEWFLAKDQSIYFFGEKSKKCIIG